MSQRKRKISFLFANLMHRWPQWPRLLRKMRKRELGREGVRQETGKRKAGRWREGEAGRESKRETGMIGEGAG